MAQTFAHTGGRVTQPTSHPEAEESPNLGTPWSPQVVESLYDLLYRADLGNQALSLELEALERRHGDAVYSELIHLLSHLRFEPFQARDCWRNIVTHRALGKPVDLRVALVSYFVEVNRMLKNPKVIELKLFEQTQASAYRDELTSLCNFRYFREYLAREIQRGERHTPPLSLVMIDIDNFKNYNDRNGHDAGNLALSAMARLLSDSLRKIDVAARYGGEEFALVLPSTSKTGAQLVAERARKRIEAHHFEGAETQPGGSLTVSMGIATYPADARDERGLVRCADSALYVAKTRGKNQVHLFGQNRRSYQRIGAALEGKFCLLAPEYHPLTTLNLSEGGMLFVVNRRLPVGALLDISLALPGSLEEITASGRVIRVEERQDGGFEAALRIVDLPTKDQILLSRFLRELEPEAEADSGASLEPQRGSS